MNRTRSGTDGRTDGRTAGRTDGRTVRLLYASQSSFGGIKSLILYLYKYNKVGKKLEFPNNIVYVSIKMLLS